MTIEQGALYEQTRDLPLRELAPLIRRDMSRVIARAKKAGNAPAGLRGTLRITPFTTGSGEITVTLRGNGVTDAWAWRQRDECGRLLTPDARVLHDRLTEALNAYNWHRTDRRNLRFTPLVKFATETGTAGL